MPWFKHFSTNVGVPLNVYYVHRCLSVAPPDPDVKLQTLSDIAQVCIFFQNFPPFIRYL